MPEPRVSAMSTWSSTTPVSPCTYSTPAASERKPTRVVRIPFVNPRTLQLRTVTSARSVSTGVLISMPRPCVPSGSWIVAPWQSSVTFEVEIVTPPV